MSLESRVRSREVPVRSEYLGEAWVTGFAHTVYYQPTSYSNEVCVDATHPGPPYKSGGGFVLTKSTVSRQWSGKVDWNRGIYHYSGGFTCLGPDPWGSISLPTWSTDATVLGTKGWNYYRPGHPQASMGQFLIELHRIPTIPLRELLRLRKGLFAFHKRYQSLGLGRSAGREFLNIEYGWRPFLGDLRRYVHAMNNLAKTLKWLKDHNGKKVKTGGTVANESTTTTTSGTAVTLHPILVTSWYVDPLGKGSWTVDHNVKTEAWFSALWSYYVRDIESPKWTAKALAVLFGLYPSPSLLWEVLPWSWLIDWAANVGTVLSNMSPTAVGHPTAQHAYVMVHQVDEYVRTETNTFWTGGIPTKVTLSATRTARRETKVRQAASPFGFGLESGSLTDEQLLILLALGISRHW